MEPPSEKPSESDSNPLTIILVLLAVFAVLAVVGKVYLLPYIQRKRMMNSKDYKNFFATGKIP